jgi:hypothetical protein
MRRRGRVRLLMTPRKTNSGGRRRPSYLCYVGLRRRELDHLGVAQLRGTRMTPPWSGPVQTAWKACFWIGSTLVLLAITGGIWKTDLKVANPEFLLPAFIVGVCLLSVPAAVSILEAWRSSTHKEAAAPMPGNLKVTVKEPKPNTKHPPPVLLAGTINKKLPEGLKLWLVNVGTGTGRWPQGEVTLESDNWRNWSVVYRPGNFEDNEPRNLRIYVVGQDGLALIQAYDRINNFHGKHAPPGGLPGLTLLTEDMKPVSPIIPIRLEKTRGAPTAPSSGAKWQWAPLTAAEIDELYERLRGKGQHSIHVACDRTDCEPLATSFDHLFKRLAWPSHVGGGGLFATGVTGILINPDDEVARLLKSTIEATTALRITMGPPRPTGVTDPTMLVIGTTPASMPAAGLSGGLPGRIEICFKPGAPYEVSEISQGSRILSAVRIGLKNSGGTPLSNCKVFVTKIAPEPSLIGGLPMLLEGGGFMLRHDEPEKLIDVAAHWSHVDQFRFNAPYGFFAESYNFLPDGVKRTIEIKIDASQGERSGIFEIWTDESKTLRLKFIDYTK